MDLKEIKWEMDWIYHLRIGNEAKKLFNTEMNLCVS
jgi:hypothetical protein